MLFGYPIEATANNWFHDCIVAALESIHAETAVTTWLDHIPTTYQNRLRSRVGLRNRLEAYQNSLQTLTDTEKYQVLQALKDQNEIARLLAGEHECARVSELPSVMKAPITDLFDFAYELLTDLEIRDEHYSIIYKQTRHLCPFCGCEKFLPLGRSREDLDHYLAKRIYPFVAINLQNLAPMGKVCNSKFKLSQDFLIGDNGIRRKAFNPYNTQGVKLVLTNSQLFEGQNLSPLWDIAFDPACEEAETWNQVFLIRERFKSDFLDENFKSYLSQFRAWAKLKPNFLESLALLKKAFFEYLTFLEDEGFNNQTEIYLQRAVFKMLEVQCDDVLLQHLRDYPPTVSVNLP